MIVESISVFSVRLVGIRIFGGLLVALVAGMTGGQLWLTSTARSAAEPAVLPPSNAPAAGKLWRGVASCSAASCHGGGHAGSKGSEQTTWATRDPHSRAYEVLFTIRSRIIVKNLDGLTELRQAHPENMTLCLQCHVAPAIVGQPGIPARFHADGVSCETCHGPAERWLTEHYRPAWKRLSPTEKAATGFRATKDLRTRVEDCMGCHVGRPGMEVNLDLLAAGHPRLMFEFSAYQAIYPKHWRAGDDRQRYPDFDARSWALGQVLSAKAALELLAHRAGNPDNAWPEFAESNCYSCHQALQSQPSGRKRPALSLNDWYYAETAVVLGLTTKPVAMPAELGALRAEMARTFPRRESAAALAKQTATKLANWLEEPLPAFTNSQLRRLLAERIAAVEKEDAGGWDRATQDYLAAAAFHHALKDLDPTFSDPAMLAILPQRRSLLDFPPRSNSPNLRKSGATSKSEEP